MDYSTHCDELEFEGARFVELARGADVDAPVPACPGWNVANLLAHVGYVHRWSRYLVNVRAPQRIAGQEMGLSRGPVTADWLAQGVSELLVTLRAADPDEEMWAWGDDQHVRYWARRQLHETLVHRSDLEEALGIASEFDPDVAADAIDEFFANIERAGDFSPDVKNLVGEGDVVAFRAHEGRVWSVRLEPEGFGFVEGSLAPSATLHGPAAELLLVIYRRRAIEASRCSVEGRRDLVDHWLENSALL
jgi:uncharacterized protein (TIGR03083 family)